MRKILIGVIILTGFLFGCTSEPIKITDQSTLEAAKLNAIVDNAINSKVLPVKALGYKLGMLQFVELREHAKKDLGDKFDIKVFHDLILLPGARPMAVVKEDVNRWIAE